MTTCNGEACEECTKKCLVIHKKRKDRSPIVTSFFKIMFGGRFSSVLFIPPKFVRTIAPLVNQVTYLEDSRGHRWSVTISVVDGSLAIEQGWREFASDHSLQLGDFVVFSYIAGSHFIVQMYGRSGCEKLTFPEKRNTNRDKRTRANRSMGQVPSNGRISTDSKVPTEMTDKGSVNDQGSNSTIHSNFEVQILESRSDAKDTAKVKRATEMTPNCHNKKRTSEPAKQDDCFEVPFYMIDRNSVDRQGASTSSLFDLSNFEMFNGKSSVDGIVKKVPEITTMGKSPHSDVNPVQPQNTVINNCMEEECHIIDEVPVGKEGKSSGGCIDVPEVRYDVSDLEMPERNYNAEETAEEVPVATDEISGFSNISKQLPTINDQIKPLRTTSTVDHCEIENLEISNSETAEQVPLDTNEISGFSNISKQLPTINDQIKPLRTTSVDSCEIEMENLEISNAGAAEQVPLATNGISGFSNMSKQLPTIYDPIKQLPTMSTVDYCEIQMKNREISNGALEKHPSTKEQNGVCSGTDPVIPQREFPSHESSGRVYYVKPVSCRNPFTMQAEDNIAGKLPEVAEKVQEEKIKEKNGERPVTVKLEPEERFDFSPGVDACKVVKTENMDFAPLSPPSSVNFFCSAPAETHSFLELPVNLPVYSCKGRRLNTDRRIVLLRDSAMRKWPVIYHERSQFRVLATGWKALAKANNIQPGDICSLKLENLSEHLFQLSIQSN